MSWIRNTARNLPGIVGGCSGGKYGGGGGWEGAFNDAVCKFCVIVVAVLSDGSSMKLMFGWRRCCAARCCRFGVVAADASGDAWTSNGGVVRRLPPRRDWWRRKRGKPARLPHKNLPLKEKQFISALKESLFQFSKYHYNEVAHPLLVRDNQYRQKKAFFLPN
jgi:hypothetical protein